MSQPSEYLAAAAVMALRSTKLADLPTDQEGLNDLLNDYHAIRVSSEAMMLLLDQLSAWGMVKQTDDEYAGKLLQLRAAKSDATWEQANSEVLDKAWEGGDEWFKRIFGNQKFWTDLAQQPPVIRDTDEASEEIPASDRIVSLSHNQFKALEGPSDSLIGELEKDNGVPEEPGLRERVLGQLRAGRELLRAGIFSVELFRMSMIAGLNILIEKYGDRAIGVAASTLLTVILHELGLPGF